MKLLLDADGLIKLQRAGVLGHVAESFSCTVPQAVYDEAVTSGKAHFHRDAEAIERIVAQSIAIAPTQESNQLELNLGAGETAILALVTRHMHDFVVVSDDRRFLALLRRRGVQHLAPAHLLVVLARRGILTMEEAREALERLRPLIRLSVYWSIRQDLEHE